MPRIRKITMKQFALTMRGLLLALCISAVMPNSATAGSTIYVGRKVARSSQISMDQIDHSAWDRLLAKYVDDDGFVNYRSWHASSQDQRALTSYLNDLSRANPTASSSRDAKLAFWINAYNAVTLYGILREYPTSSIRNHTARFFGYNIWKDLQLVVGGQAYSLEHMEHEVLRKMGEPRIHFAIVCASVGCPRLRNHAYTTEQVRQQLEENAKDFFGRSRNFRYDQRNGRFYVSSILSWFGEDFGNGQAAQLKTISQWLPTQAARTAALRNAVRVFYLDYNWNLNDQASLPRMARGR